MVEPLISGLTAEINPYQIIANYLGISVATAIAILTLAAIWSLIWKGFALWKSSKKNNLIWFIVLLVVNTFGILEILYIFVFSKISLKTKKTIKKEVKRR